MCQYVVSMSASVASQPKRRNVSAAPCPGKSKLRVSFAQKLVPWRHSDWCIRQPTKPYFEAYWSGDSAVFWSQLSFVRWQSLCNERWKMAFWFSEQNLMAAMRMHLPNVFPSVCLRWNEACSRGLPPNNWLLQSTMQYWSFENMPMAKHLWPPKKPSSNLRCSNNDLVDCSEASTCKMLFPPGAWAHSPGNSWLACLKPSALSRKIFSQPPLYRQCKKHPKKYAGGETSWQLI